MKGWSSDLRANERPQKTAPKGADRHPDRRTWQLYDQLGPEGPSWWKSYFSVIPFYILIGCLWCSSTLSHEMKTHKNCVGLDVCPGLPPPPPQCSDQYAQSWKKQIYMGTCIAQGTSELEQSFPWPLITWFIQQRKAKKTVYTSRMFMRTFLMMPSNI